MNFFKNSFFKITKSLFPFLGIFFVIVLFRFTDWVLLKYYPVCINFCVFCIFFGSLFQKETIIQKYARMIEKDLKPKALEYTRNVTYVWAVVTFVNFSISLASVFLSARFWELYNGLISYVFVGTVFGIEYIVRRNFKRKHDC